MTIEQLHQQSNFEECISQIYYMKDSTYFTIDIIIKNRIFDKKKVCLIFSKSYDYFSEIKVN